MIVIILAMPQPLRTATDLALASNNLTMLRFTVNTTDDETEYGQFRTAASLINNS